MFSLLVKRYSIFVQHTPSLLFLQFFLNPHEYFSKGKVCINFQFLSMHTDNEMYSLQSKYLQTQKSIWFVF